MENNSNIKIKYDGRYPCLCMGHLEVWLDNKYYDFGEYCLSSGGSVWFDGDWCEHIEVGPWSLSDVPENFPKEKIDDLLAVINNEIPSGCCGGCV